MRGKLLTKNALLLFISPLDRHYFESVISQDISMKPEKFFFKMCMHMSVQW